MGKLLKEGHKAIVYMKGTMRDHLKMETMQNVTSTGIL